MMRWFSAAKLPLLILISVTTQAHAITTDSLGLAVAQNSEARSKLKSFGYRYIETDVNYLKGQLTANTTTNAVWRQRGALKWIEYSRHAQLSPDPKNFQDNHIAAYIGLTSSGFFKFGSANPVEYKHDSPDFPSDPAKALVYSQFVPDAVQDGFSMQTEPLERLTSPRSGFRWEVHGPDAGANRPSYLLKRFRSVNAKEFNDIEISVDPERGWLITGYKLFNLPNHVFVECQVIPKYDDRFSVWHPQEVRKNVYEPNTSNLTRSDTVTVEDFTVQDWDDDQFTVKGLSFPTGSYLQRISTDGKHEVLIATKKGLVEFTPNVKPHRLVASKGVSRHFIIFYAIGAAIFAGGAVVFFFKSKKGGRGGQPTT